MHSVCTTNIDENAVAHFLNVDFNLFKEYFWQERKSFWSCKNKFDMKLIMIGLAREPFKFWYLNSPCQGLTARGNVASGGVR
jgi:hypothetical protein